MDLHSIKDPQFLKGMDRQELDELASEIRSFLIEKIAKNGGHLSSNLGVVELSIAMHKVFDSPKDKLIFDVGHQAYTHKILTGRAAKFDTLRQFEGLSGYLKRAESPHDVWEAGHSSTAIAALAGFEMARVQKQQEGYCVALVGDGSLNSGLSFEALNFLGHRHDLRPIIILNDNEMSISKNVGTLAKLLTSMRSSKTYVKATKTGKFFPKFLVDLKDRIGMMIRGFAKNMTIFDELGFQYYGPIDGHDISKIIKYLELIKKSNRPTVLHVVTKKGKGYLPAENDSLGIWHGVGPFDIETGNFQNGSKEFETSWSNIISEIVLKFADQDENLRVVIPAMIQGSGFHDFQVKYPDRIIDVGICESFAVCFSGALSSEGVPVFIPIYSSFLQRAYDQVSHDIARQNLHVVFGLDRSGLVGDDGETHQGIYDIAYLSHIPNMEIIEPKNALEAKLLLDYAFHRTKNPIAIRYPRGKTLQSLEDPKEILEHPSWEVLSTGDVCVVTYGENVERISKLRQEQNLDIQLINARFIKPLDTELLIELVKSHTKFLVVESVTKIGGLGSMILTELSNLDIQPSQFRILGLPDRFIEQGKKEEIQLKYQLDDETIIHSIQEMSQKR